GCGGRLSPGSSTSRFAPPECRSDPHQEGKCLSSEACSVRPFFVQRWQQKLGGGGPPKNSSQSSISIRPNHRADNPTYMAQVSHSIQTSAAKGSSLSSARASRHVG